MFGQRQERRARAPRYRRGHPRRRQLDAELLHRRASARSARARGPPDARRPTLRRVQGDHRQPPDPRTVMRLRRLLTILVLVVVLVTVVRPARAEALEPTIIVLIISGAIVVVAERALLLLASGTRYPRRVTAKPPPRRPATSSR